MPFGREQSQPAGRRELDDRGTARVDEAVASLDWVAQRPIDCRRPILAAICVDQRLDGPIAPVRDGNLDHLGVRKDFTDAARDRGRGLRRGESALERVRRDDYFHGGGKPPPWKPLPPPPLLVAVSRGARGGGRSKFGLSMQAFTWE